MTSDDVENLVSKVLTHHGVKGMRWGIHKELSPAAQIAKAQKKAARLDGNKVIQGYSLQGDVLKRMYKKQLSKNPNFAYNKLSKTEQRIYRGKAFNKASRKVLLRGVSETALILAGLNLAIGKMNASPKTIQGARVATLLLAGQAGRIIIADLRDIHEARTLDRLHNQIDDLKNKK